MKKIILSLSIALSGYCSFAHNTFPSTGKAGIGTLYPGYNSSDGTTTPNVLLDLYNSNPSTMTLLRVTGTTEANGNYSGLLLGAGGQQGRGKGGVLFAPYGTTYGLGSLHFAVNGTANNSEATLADAKMTILSNGYVGIGTTTPASLFHINGTGSLAETIQTTSGDNNSVGLVLKGGATNATWSIATNSSSTSGNADDFIIFKSAGSVGPKVIVRDNGNVLIGKNLQGNPNYKLDVNGSARANEIVVNSNGADFVFDKNYALPKLSDVKTYIDKNKHLPEIPSAQEMQTNGMSLGEINTKLLQKVEELTLYLIEKDKEVTELRKANSLFKEQIESQQSTSKQQSERITVLEKALLKLTENPIKIN